MSQLLVEGGGELHASFVEAGLADRLILYLAPRLIGGSAARSFLGGVGPATLEGAARLSVRSAVRVGPEFLIESDFV